MTTQLTPMGRVWAERHAEESIVANVALYGDGWPNAFAETARTVANEEGERAAEVNAKQ